MDIHINEYDMCEFIGQIIDIFEDFLDERGIVLDNPDRDADNKNGDCSNIYGMDYGDLQQSIEQTLINWSK